MNRVVKAAFPFEGWLDPLHVAMADDGKMDFVSARNFEYTCEHASLMEQQKVCKSVYGRSPTPVF
jgi:hypothetical protein